jgi:hypothetical protein
LSAKLPPDPQELKNAILRLLPIYELVPTELNDPAAHFNFKVKRQSTNVPIELHLVYPIFRVNTLFVALGMNLPTQDANLRAEVTKLDYLYELQLALEYLPIRYEFGPSEQNIQYLRMYILLNPDDVIEGRLVEAIETMTRAGSIVLSKILLTERKLKQSEDRLESAALPVSVNQSTLPFNINIKIDNINTASAQQSMTSVQSVNVTQEQKVVLADLIREIKDLLVSEHLDNNQKEELEPQVKILEVNLKKPNSAKDKVKQALTSAKEVLDGVAAAAPVVMKIIDFLGRIG